MHPGIKLRHIRAFLDIAETGNLSAVARQQGLTQPALSRSLAELEALIGAALFLRQGRRLVLTPEGALFRQHAAAAIQTLEAGVRALAPGAGRVALGVLPTASTRLFPQLALRLAQRQPDLTLQMVTGPQAHLMRLLREGRVDAVLGRLPGAAEMAGLTFLHLYEEDVVLALRARHPLAGRPPAEVLGRVPLILPPADAIIRRTVDDYLATLGLPRPRATYETVAPEIGRGLVLASDAVWFISHGVVAADVARGDMALLPTRDRALAGAVGLTLPQDRSLHPDLALLARLAQEAAVL
ncbi:MAG: LysR family transcriptional regulator [Rhodobacterales bacterium]|nr:LysR family transcriptional regulator [Rhodobacterales bacterium]